MPVKYSEGFNPHPKLSLGNPLPLGIESVCEYFDLELIEPISPQEFKNKLNKILPTGIEIVESHGIDEMTPSISSTMCISEYEILVDTLNSGDEIDYYLEINELLGLKNIDIEKKKKKGKSKITTKVNIRPFIFKLSVEDICGNTIRLNTIVMTGEQGNVKPIELLEAINKNTKIRLDLDSFEAKKIETYSQKFEG
jgi:radical SAM-linked protein